MRVDPRKLALLLALYFVQGMPFGFQAQALPVYLRTQGVSLMAIGFLGVLWLPWVAKALWAPLVERYGSARLGRRKSWIIAMQAGLAASCAAAAFVPMPESLPVLLGLIFVMNLCAATQDIAVDGLAVDLLSREELGEGNIAQVVGYKLGMLTGGGLLVLLHEYIGWRGLFLAMAVLSLLVLAAVGLTLEPPPAQAPSGPGERPGWGEMFQRLKHAWLLPGTGWLLLFIATYKLGETMADVLYKPFLVDSGFTPQQIALWSTTWGTVVSLAGSTVGGVLATRLPLLSAVALTASLRVGPLLGRWWLASHGVTEGSFIAVTLAEEFFGGALTTAMFAFMMSRVDRRIGAVHFTLLASVEALGKAPAGALAGLLAHKAHWSYAQVFLLGVVLSVGFLALLAPMRRRAPEQLSPALSA